MRAAPLATALLLFVFHAVPSTTAGQETPLISAEVFQARTVAIENHTAKQKAADQADKEISKWGRFQVVNLTEVPDLIFVLTREPRPQASTAHGVVYQGLSTSKAQPRREMMTVLTVLEGRTRRQLWTTGISAGSQSKIKYSSNPIKLLRKTMEKRAQENPLGQKQEQIDPSPKKVQTVAGNFANLPLPELMSVVSELHGLEPAPDQKGLPSILSRVGRNLVEFSAKLPNVLADEEITMVQLEASGMPKSAYRERCSYLILSRPSGNRATIEEYRTDAQGERMTPRGVEHGFVTYEGFAAMWIHFHPSNESASDFRYLGKQVSDGRQTHVVAFAQRAAWASSMGRVVVDEASAVVQYQGIAWIEAQSYQIAQMRVDLLSPRPDLGLETQTTEVRYHEVQFPQISGSLWLPTRVRVTTDWYDRHFRNEHRYSNYRLFTVETKIKPAESEPP